ncbi:MAG TPA: N-acetylneuraminate synthase family protein [Phycisphaerae bacterium]|nr:N-acetylneuraminate synthase family protein [Phycisphaerae bacterium]
MSDRVHSGNGYSAEEEPSFQIGAKRVGPPGFVYVIAEAGVNHDGEPAAARELVVAAAEAGADAVKFQVFAADRLVTRQAPSAEYQKRAGEAQSQHGMLKRLELSHERFIELADFARSKGIEFLATPFSVPDLQFLASIPVSAIKLASTDLVNALLLDVAAGTGLPVVASTGAADLDEVAASVRRFDRPGAGPLALLHCISSYPTPEDQVNLAAIATLARTFRRVSGFSDHTESMTMGGYAAAAGARIIEKHLTLDRRRKGPDHAFSLEPKAMAEYVRNVRRASVLVGDGRLDVTEVQREVRSLARASLVADQDLAAGVVVTRNMLAAKRPGGGISPMEIDEVIGRRLKKAVAADTALRWEDIE